MQTYVALQINHGIPIPNHNTSIQYIPTPNSSSSISYKMMVVVLSKQK